MYKLIIGNVRVTVYGDIPRTPAVAAAKQAIGAAAKQNKLLSHVEISEGDVGLEIKTTEKVGAKVARKTLKQSLLDSIHTAILEKLFPDNAFAKTDTWFDSDTGQEWTGEMVTTTKEELLNAFRAWLKTQQG